MGSIDLFGLRALHLVDVGSDSVRFDTVCLACGWLRSRTTRKKPGDVKCSGRGPLPPFAAQALAVGAFDEPILEGPDKLRELAWAQGWVHPDLRFYPLEPD